MTISTTAARTEQKKRQMRSTTISGMPRRACCGCVSVASVTDHPVVAGHNVGSQGTQGASATMRAKSC